MTTNGNLTIKEALNKATAKLSQNTENTTPRLDSEVLLSTFLNCSRIDLIINCNNVLDKTQETIYFDMIQRRLNNEPISYITNKKEFMSLEFFVEQGVLIPRPETEMLTEWIIDHYKKSDNVSILDLCTGSGAIAVSLAYYLKNASIDAADKYQVCVDTANKNAITLGVDDRISVYKADILTDILPDKKYDCIVSNPPYIKNSDLSTLPPDVKDFEPDYALNGGKSGLIFYEKIINLAKKMLNINGVLVFEIGYDQGESVSALIENTKMFYSIKITKDLAGLDRMITAIKGDV